MRLFTFVQLSLVGAAGTMTLAPQLPAQSSTSAAQSAESRQVAPRFASGVTAGAMRFSGGRTERAVSILLMLRPLPWLMLSTAPGIGQTSFAGVASSGLTDIPFSATAVRGFGDVTWSPSIAGALSTSVSPADTSVLLGLGRSVVSAMGAFTVSPTDRLDLSTGVAKPLTANGGNGSLSLESAMSFGRTTGSLGFSAEVGRADSAAVLSRSLAAGIAYSLSGPLTLTVDGSHGLSGGAPSWTFSVGIGTAFAGVSPLSPTSALKRLKSTLGAKTVSTSGYSKTASGATACKKAGTC